MIIRRDWTRVRKDRLGIRRVYYVTGLFLFGIIPLYIHMKEIR